MLCGLERCAVLEMRRGRKVDSSGVDLPHDQPIGEVEEEGFRYLGILQLDQTLNTKMKGKITAEYVRRVKKLCRSSMLGLWGWYATMQVSWIGQWKNKSAWIGKLGR